MEAKPSDASYPSLVPWEHLKGKPAIPLKRPVILIGSRSNARIHLISTSVSKAHALLVKSNGRFYVRDLASREKVIINGEAVRDASLTDGDLVKIGKFTFKYVEGDGGGVLRKSKPLVPAGLYSPGAPIPIPLDERVCLVGRRSNSDIPLLEASVSTSHAVIFEMDGRRYVRDLGSRTGTFVNGVKIHQHALNEGDHLRIGETDLSFHFSPQSPTVAADDLDLMSGAAIEAGAGIAADDLIDMSMAPSVSPSTTGTTDEIDFDLPVETPVEISPVAVAPAAPVAPVIPVEPEGLSALDLEPLEPVDEALEAPLPVEAAEAAPEVESIPAEIPVEAEAVEPIPVEVEPEPVPVDATDEVVIPVAEAPIAIEPEVADEFPVADELAVADEVVKPAPADVIETVEPKVVIPPIDEAEIPLEVASAEPISDVAETVADIAPSIPDGFAQPAETVSTGPAVLEPSGPPTSMEAPGAATGKRDKGRKGRKGKKDDADVEQVGVTRTRKSRKGPRADIVQGPPTAEGEAKPLELLAPVESAESLSAEDIEILSPTESDPESAFEFPTSELVTSDEEVAPAKDVAAAAAALTDTTFGRSVDEFVGASTGEIVEAPEPARAEIQQPELELETVRDESAPLPELDLEVVEAHDEAVAKDVSPDSQGPVVPIAELETEPKADRAASPSELRVEDLLSLAPAEPVAEAAAAPTAAAESELDLALELAGDEVAVAGDEKPHAAVDVPVIEDEAAAKVHAIDDELDLSDVALPEATSDDFDALIEDALADAKPQKADEPVPALDELDAVVEPEARRALEEKTEAEPQKPAPAAPAAPQARSWGANQENFLGGVPVNLANVPVPPGPVRNRVVNPFAQEILSAETAHEFVREAAEAQIEPVDEAELEGEVAATDEESIDAIAEAALAAEPVEEVEEVEEVEQAPATATGAAGAEEVNKELDDVSAIIDEMIAKPAESADAATAEADAEEAEKAEAGTEPVAEATPDVVEPSTDGKAAETPVADADAATVATPPATPSVPEPGVPVRLTDGAGNGEPSTLPPVRPVPRKMGRKPVEPRRTDRSNRGELPSQRKMTTPFGAFGPAAGRDRVDETIPPYEPKQNGNGTVRNLAGGFGGEGVPPVIETDVFSRMSPPAAETVADPAPAEAAPAPNNAPSVRPALTPMELVDAEDAPGKRPTDLATTANRPANGEAAGDAYWSGGGRVVSEALPDAPARAPRRGRAPVPPNGTAAAAPRRQRADDDYLSPAEERRRRIRRIPVLLLAWIALTVATAAAVYRFIPQAARVEGNLVYNGLTNLNENERKEFKRTQRDRLLGDYIRPTAMRLLSEQSAVTSPGFLSSAAGYKSVIDGARWSDTKPNVLTLKMQSDDRAGDPLRLNAVMAAFYQSNDVLVVDAKRKRDALEDLKSSIASSRQRLEQLDAQLKEARTVGENRPTVAQIKAVEDEAAGAEKAYNEAISAVKNLQVDLQRLREQPVAAVNGTANADAPQTDEDVKRMQTELDDLQAKLAAAKAARAAETDTARKSLDAAMEQFQGQIADAQKSMKGNPELTAYITLASKFQKTTRDMLDGMVKKQQQNFTMLTELRQRLSEQSEAKRREQLEKDPQLRELIDQRELINRQYNTAIGAGLKKEADDLKAQLELTESLVKARQELVGKDPIYAEAIGKLEQVIAATERGMSEDRKKIDAELEQLQASFTQAQPAVEKLPEEQKNLAADLEKRLKDVNDARKQYNTAIAEGAAEQDVLVTAIQAQIVSLQGGIDLRKKQSAEKAKQALSAQEEQKRQEAVAAKEAALAAATKTESESQSKYLAKKTKLLNLQSQLASARTAGEQSESLQQEKSRIERQYENQMSTVDLRQREVASIVELLPVSDDAVKVVDEADNRPMYVAGAAGLWFVVFGGLILMTLRGLNVEESNHGLPSIDSIRVAPLGSASFGETPVNGTNGTNLVPVPAEPVPAELVLPEAKDVNGEAEEQPDEQQHATV